LTEVTSWLLRSAAWTLRTIARHRTAVGTAAMAWNRSLVGELALVLQDGSVHTLELSERALCVATSESTVADVASANVVIRPEAPQVVPQFSLAHSTTVWILHYGDSHTIMLS
jgi:hypothetical protein